MKPAATAAKAWRAAVSANMSVFLWNVYTGLSVRWFFAFIHLEWANRLELHVFYLLTFIYFYWFRIRFVLRHDNGSNVKLCSTAACEKRSRSVIHVRTWSHQHSEKLGNWCSRLYSRNSNITLIIIHIHQSRIIRVWRRKQSTRLGE